MHTVNGLHLVSLLPFDIKILPYCYASSFYLLWQVCTIRFSQNCEWQSINFRSNA
jgi:hypothetical protein